MTSIKKRDIKKVINMRFNILKILTIFLFLIISIKLVNITMVNNKLYTEELLKLTERLVSGSSAPRGRIYDRNYKLIVDNKAIPVIYYKRDSNITIKKEVELAYLLSEKVDLDFSLVSERNLKDFFIIQNEDYTNSLISDGERVKLKNRELSNDDIYYLKINRITQDDLQRFNAADIKSAYIYYLMNNGYEYNDKVIKRDNITDEEMAYIAENIDSLYGVNIKYDWKREYLYGDTFRSILGNVSNIAKEDKDYYLSLGYAMDDVVGSSYLEKQYEDVLKGEKATYKMVSNSNVVMNSEGKKGHDIVLTIDIDLQWEIEKILEEEIIKTKGEPSTSLFNHIYMVIQEPNTGEILAMTGKQMLYKEGLYEAYDVTPGVLMNPITPGSVVKGASMLVGYNTKAVEIGEKQRDECIKLFSKPRKCSWMTLGVINDITAMKNSSNIYQFKIAMKVASFNYSYNAKFTDTGNAFDIYRNTFNEFGLGVKTQIDLPLESIGNIGKDSSADLLLNFAIGQYDTYTAMQLSQYVTTIASDGNRLKPQLLKRIHETDDNKELGTIIYEAEPIVLNKLETEELYLKRVQEGFREVMVSGLGKNFMGNSPNPVGKTGTSESFMDTDGDGVIDTPTLSNAFVGYAPYDNPKMTITTVFPNLVNQNSGSDSRSYAQKRITKRVSEKFFEMYQ